jgi:hypothetical protein
MATTKKPPAKSPAKVAPVKRAVPKQKAIVAPVPEPVALPVELPVTPEPEVKNAEPTRGSFFNSIKTALSRLFSRT